MATFLSENFEKDDNSPVLVTVVSAIYNLYQSGRVETFRQMVESVQGQSCSSVEHLLIDGGSNDGTVELLDEYQQRGKISTFLSAPDRGIYDAYNKGVAAARGRYLVFLNSDDYFYDSTVLQQSVSALEEEEADFFCADTVMFKKNKIRVKTADLLSVCYNLPVCHQALVVKRSLFDQCGPFDLNYQLAADYKFILRLYLSGAKGIYRPILFVCYRDGGFSADLRQIYTEYQQIIHEVYGARYGLSLKECKTILNSNFGIRTLRLLYKIDDPLIRRSLWHKVTVKSVRRWLFSLRLRRSEQSLKIFGWTLFQRKRHQR